MSYDLTPAAGLVEPDDSIEDGVLLLALRGDADAAAALQARQLQRRREDAAEILLDS